MTVDAFVREGRPDDATTIAELQVRTWRAVYADVVPATVLDELTGPQSVERFTEQWRASTQNPPSSRHRLLVAVQSGVHDAAGITGFAAIGPAGDEDRWPGTDAEIYELHVAPEHVRQGHGGRLVNAAADTLRDDGFGTACIWIVDTDTVTRDFLTTAGWAADGARREIDLGSPVTMSRLHTAL